MVKFPEDPAERELLRALQENSQRSLRELAKATGLPISTVHEKIKRLERDGYIRKYVAVLDEKKLGYSVTGLILVSVVYSGDKTVSQKAIAERIAKLPNVQDVSIITGDWDIAVKVKAMSVDSLGAFVTERLRNISGVGKTLSMIVYESIKEERAIEI